MRDRSPAKEEAEANAQLRGMHEAARQIEGAKVYAPNTKGSNFGHRHPGRGPRRLGKRLRTWGEYYFLGVTF